MKTLFYYFFRFKAWLISLLPFRCLYVLSDFFYFILYYIVAYRKKAVLSNLSNSFPEKSQEEIKSIAKKFYHNLADIGMEVIKWQRMSADQMTSRLRFENHQIMLDAFTRNQSVIVAIGHCGNWEWMGTALGLITDYHGYAIVKPLSDPNFNKYVCHLRYRLNPDSTILFKETFRKMIQHSKERLTFNVMAADQTPTRDEINYWSEFLNQDTPFFLGVEKISKALDFTVVFIDIQREKRGHYKGVISLISDKPNDTAEFEITERYIRMLETAIRNRPDNWLWSHRRWKHERNED